MCGICGFINYKEKIDAKVIIDRMVTSINHRGPDDRGDYIEETSCQLALGHARLSIIDLSTAGHQPMKLHTTEQGNLVIVYNGEVYNHQEIRKELEVRGHIFETSSDTEVILHAFQEWRENCVSRFVGMFAFAIYDNQKRKLYLCRDRAGVKPLYWHSYNGLFAFASELKSMMAIPQYPRDIDSEAKNSFLTVGYIPRKLSIFKHTYKLEAGHWLIIDIENQKVEKYKYWDLSEFYRKPKLTVPYEDAKAEIKHLFKSAFGYRLVSDVPVGVLLSSGFDSTAVVATLVRELGVTPHTFTIGFHNHIDEVPEAEEISRLLGTKQTTQYCSEDDVKDLVTRLPFVYCEPFADTSALPSILVAQLVKKHVTVVLSADGGDEIFAGYYNYDRMANLYPRLAKTPSFIQHHFHPIYRISNTIIPESFSNLHIINQQIDAAFSNGTISQKSWYDNRYLYMQRIVSEIAPDLKGNDYRSMANDILDATNSPEYALLSDWKTQMTDEYLIKVDRAMMSVSLEGREPMLDHRIAEYVAQLPWEYKYKDGVKKRILKDIVYDYLPKELMDKPKRGFSPPVMRWMRTDLKDYVLDNLEDSKLIETGFEKKRTRKVIDTFMNGDDNFFGLVWRLVQYQRWYQYWMKYHDGFLN